MGNFLCSAWFDFMKAIFNHIFLFHLCSVDKFSFANSYPPLNFQCFCVSVLPRFFFFCFCFSVSSSSCLLHVYWFALFFFCRCILNVIQWDPALDKRWTQSYSQLHSVLFMDPQSNGKYSHNYVYAVVYSRFLLKSFASTSRPVCPLFCDISCDIVLAVWFVIIHCWGKYTSFCDVLGVRLESWWFLFI